MSGRPGAPAVRFAHLYVGLRVAPGGLAYAVGSVLAGAPAVALGWGEAARGGVVGLRRRKPGGTASALLKEVHMLKKIAEFLTLKWLWDRR